MLALMNPGRGIHLLPTKLVPPPIRGDLVERSRLVERIENNLERAVTLILAPAGSGKSTLLAQWVDATDADVAWVSLEGADDHPARFLAYLLSALRRASSEVGREAETVLNAEIEELRPSLAQRVVIPLAGRVAPIVLVLEDLHVISDPTVFEGLEWLVEHGPPSLHLILATRQAPRLPLTRWRVRGQLFEVKAPDLRLTDTEAEAFYNRLMGLGLSTGEVKLLQARTEGWAAGAQLLALSLRAGAKSDRCLSSWSRERRETNDFLVSEVLNHQSPDRRQFLLETSILWELSGPLCNAVTERNDAEALLHGFEQDQLFLRPTDPEGRRWRYHQLFKDAVEATLRVEDAARIPVLHRRAVDWLRRHGHLSRAGDHAIAAGDFETLAGLLADVGYVGGCDVDPATIARWLEAVPLAVKARHPAFALSEAWLEMLRGHLKKAETLVQQLLGDSEEDPDDGVRAFAHGVCGLAAFLDNDLEGAAAAVAPVVDRKNRSDPAGALIGFVGAAASAWFGEPETMMHRIRAAELAARASGVPFLELMTTAYRVMINAYTNCLEDGRRQLERIRQDALAEGRAGEPGMQIVYAQLVTLLYEMGRAEEALDLAESLLPQLEEVTSATYASAAVHTARIRAYIALDQLDAAIESPRGRVRVLRARPGDFLSTSRFGRARSPGGPETGGTQPSQSPPSKCGRSALDARQSRARRGRAL